MSTITSMRPALAGLAISVLLVGCELPPPASTQQGYRGTGMVAVENPRTAQAKRAANPIPDAVPPVDPGSPPATSVYKNVTVLTDLGVAEFTRLMVAMTNWVSPEQGCNYCHEATDLASDAPYTKVVARRMLQMTRDINSRWQAHVGNVGVTCLTCHRGQPVPPALWVADAGPRQAGGVSRGRAGQNSPAPSVALAALPYDPFSAFLTSARDIRIVPTAALPAGPGPSVQATELTYALMMHMSDALGVNCTACHNSRSFVDWSESNPARVTAWHGIRMVRDLNLNYLEPLKQTLPPNRHGPMGDAPKVNCASCHRGVSKPFAGASLLKDHPELAAAGAPRAVPAGEGK